MRFTETPLPGTFLIDIEPIKDERGFFARTWCTQEFSDHGLNAGIAQCSISFNERHGTLRGMHYQVPPDEEAKLIRCTAGAIYDVIVDLRTNSPTFKKWYGVELTAANRKIVFVPLGCAHGFLTLDDRTEVLYLISHPYHPESARGVRWNDPVLSIKWPREVQVISERDNNYPDFIV